MSPSEQLDHPCSRQPPPATGGGPERIERRVLHCLSLGLVVFDCNLGITYQNPAASSLLTADPQHGPFSTANSREAVTTSGPGSAPSLADALATVTLDSRYQDWGTALRDVVAHLQERRFEQIVLRSTGGQERLLDLLCLPLTSPDGGVIGGILVMEDVTAWAGLEKRLAVSERLAAVGKLAARVAHELNNPLDGILRYLNLAIRSVEVNQTDRLGNYLLEARGGLIRMAEILRELVEFSRSSHTAFEDTAINSALEEAVKVMSEKADAAGVSIVCRLRQDMPAMRGTSLFQVFCNLIKNAIDAMPDGGTLSVITEVVGTEAIMRFEDTGVGLPQDMERMFEPFFTTKPAGKGTGLGLAICKDIVEKFNGRITPDRRPQGGSVFTIHIPLSSCARLRRPDCPPRAASLSPNTTEAIS